MNKSELSQLASAVALESIVTRCHIDKLVEKIDAYAIAKDGKDGCSDELFRRVLEHLEINRKFLIHVSGLFANMRELYSWSDRVMAGIRDFAKEEKEEDDPVLDDPWDPVEEDRQ